MRVPATCELFFKLLSLYFKGVGPYGVEGFEVVMVLLEVYGGYGGLFFGCCGAFRVRSPLRPCCTLSAVEKAEWA